MKFEIGYYWTESYYDTIEIEANSSEEAEKEFEKLRMHGDDRLFSSLGFQEVVDFGIDTIEPIANPDDVD